LFLHYGVANLCRETIRLQCIQTTVYPREYWVIYRGPGFLALPSASYLSFSVFLLVAGRAYLWERGKGGGVGTRSQIIQHRVAWFSVSHSILSECAPSITNKQIRCNPQHSLPLFPPPSADCSQCHSGKFFGNLLTICIRNGLYLSLWPVLYACSILFAEMRTDLLSQLLLMDEASS
jgi:hypothetical protein